MTDARPGKTVVEFPSELAIRFTRDFDAPIQLVFDVLTKEEHVRKTFAPFGEDVKVCSIDLRVGGEHRCVMVTEDGTEMSFHGTFLEVEPPTRTVQTWLFDGWPDAEAVETVELREADGVTTMTHTTTFRDLAGRRRMTRFDGIEASFDHVEALLRTLQEDGAAAR
jgi:uncharacterized protein YndB with AHSA1/START domain